MGGAIAVIIGVVFGAVVIVGGAFYVATRPSIAEPETVVAAAAVADISPELPSPETAYEGTVVYYEEAVYEKPEEYQKEAIYEDPEEYRPAENYGQPPVEPLTEYTTITISAAGCTTLGGDSRWAGYHRFMGEFDRGGHSFFLRNVRDIFYSSDLSILNLEGTLTYAYEHMDKEFVFRGPPHFARILSYGAVDVVTIANNHTIDFFDRGYYDTRRALYAEGIAYFGNEFNTILDVNGINVGLFGFRVWNPYQYNRNRIAAAVEDLRARGAQLVIAYHHWGYENVNMANDVQRTMGRWTVEAGADLVLGSHPHVIQGIEIYQDVHIVYSLANFSFGGNSNPPDQDSFIFQQTFTFRDGELLHRDDAYLIPVFVSSTRSYNNFQPTVAEGADADRILQRLRTYSSWLE